MPGDIQLELTSLPVELKTGAQYNFKITRFGLSQALQVDIESVEPGKSIVEKAKTSFVDDWANTIIFEEHGENSTLLTTMIDYKLPYGILGTLADDLFVRNDLKRVLIYSHNKIKSFFD
jgi:hypothetical protein